MKLSENFVEVLKNFSSINSGLVVKPGKVLRTISSNKAILAESHNDEEFTQEFGIYDLNKMLGLLSMNKDAAEVSIEKDSLVFTGLNGKGKIRQRFTEPKLILAPPNKNINVPGYEVTVKLTVETFNWIFDVASILKCPNIVIKKDEGSDEITIAAVDVKGEIVDSAEVTVEGTSDQPFQAVLKIENLKVIPGNYQVEISKLGVSLFTHTTKKLRYWVAIEQASSTFAK